MSNNLLLDWISSDHDFQQGLELLIQAQPDHPRIFIFQTFGSTPTHNQWLLEAITEASAQSTPSNRSETSKTKKKSTSLNSPSSSTRWFDREKLSEGLLEEYTNRIRPLYSTRQAVHRSFDPEQSLSHNASVSQELKRIQHQLDVFFNRAKKYIEEGVEENNGMFARYKALDRAIQTHIQYISRNKNNQKRSNEVAERQIALDQDNKSLKLLEDRLYDLT